MREKEIKEEIFRLVEEYYNIVHKPLQSLNPQERKINHAGRVYDSEEMISLVESALDFRLTEDGRFGQKFERDLCDFLKIKYSILTNSGSSANLLAISSLTSPELGERRLKLEDEVITTACNFPTTVTPIVQNKAIPVFVDVDIVKQNAIPEKVEEAITKKTKAIVLAHTMGNPFDLEKILKIARRNGLWVIEDNCDALGSKYKGKFTGTIGDIGTLSFYPAHHITTGEGGALTTNNDKLNKIIRSFRDWGRHCWCKPCNDDTCKKRFNWKLGDLPYGYDHKFIYSHIGYNLKMTDMQAAIGVAQLKKLPEFIKARKRNWGRLKDGLKEYKEFFILPEAQENSDPSWFGFQITLKENCPFSRNKITEYLENKNIRTRLIFSGNIIRQPNFKEIEYRVVGNLKNTDYIMNNSFFVGVYPGITNKDVDYILEKIKEFANKYD